MPGGSGPCAGRSSNVNATCNGALPATTVCAHAAYALSAKRAKPKKHTARFIAKSLFIVANRHSRRRRDRLGWNELLRVALELLNALYHRRAMNRLRCVLRWCCCCPLLQQIVDV